MVFFIYEKRVGETMKILIVEDEKHLNDLLFEYIQEHIEGAMITQSYDGFDAYGKISNTPFDVYILDVNLPHMDGFELCKKIRESYQTPIIMISALSDEQNQLHGYDLGIDEFITKPYSPKLVIKKIKAIIARYNQSDTSYYNEYGVIKYNIDKHEIFVEDIKIELNNKEWLLFNLFIENIGTVFSRESILNKVWGYDYFGGDRTVDTHIKRLRQKLHQAKDYIKTVYKSGYKFEK